MLYFKHNASEIEARFLNIDTPSILDTLQTLGAKDIGDDLLSEVIFYDEANQWSDAGRYVRLRTRQGITTLTYKHIANDTVDGAKEIEFTVPNATLAEEFLTHIGLVATRHQQKRRHTFILDGVTVDIDTWPQIPTCVELEGPSELTL